jgi:putative tricarboxylic transport membrane protein
MKLTRYATMLVTAFVLCLTGTQSALAWEPSRAVEVVVHTAPGGGSDVFARAIIDMLEKEKLVPQRMTVANRSGGSGAVAMAYVAGKADSDQTIAFFTPTWWVTPLIRKAAKFGIEDLTPVVGLIHDPTVAVVRADSPYKSMKEFVEAAKKNPGKLRQSGGSVTSPPALYRILFEKNLGARWGFISFPSGSERLANLLGGHTDIQIDQPQQFLEHIRAGTLRVIGTFTDERLEAFPDLPTVKEQDLDIPTIIQARGVLGPPGMRPEVIKYWEGVFARLLKTESWKKYAADNQIVNAYLPSAELAKFWDQQVALMRTLLQDAGMKVVR